MLSAFHQMKMRTAFIFQILMPIADNFLKMRTTQNCLYFIKRKCEQNILQNMKMLPAFHENKMWTTFLTKNDTDNMSDEFSKIQQAQ